MRGRFWGKRILLIGGTIILVGGGLYWWCFGDPIAISDVPVTSEIGWWPYQNKLSLTEFTAEAIDPRLNLFRHKFAIRFHIRGTIHGTSLEGWRPRIVRVQITGRVIAQGSYELVRDDSHVQPVADVLVVPIVEVTKDESYKGEDVPFDLKVEKVFSTMDWGKNQYECRCEGKTSTVLVAQSK